jgi:uncharacterized membrane protein YvbJ
MQTCKNCGKEVSDDDVFCVNCGNKIDGTKNLDLKDEDIVPSKPKKEVKLKQKKDNDVVEFEELPDVYHSSSRTLKAKLVFYGISAIVVIVILFFIFAALKEVFFNTTKRS